MANVGYASLQVIPVVKGIGSNVQGQIVTPLATAGSNAGAAAGRGITSGIASADVSGAATTAGNKITGSLMGALSKGVKAGGIGAVLFGGTALKMGLDRLTTIEDSTNSLKTIMGDATKAGELMGEIKKTVSGTPFNLDQFAEAGKNMVAMNISAEKVPTYLTAIGEAAAASGKGAEGVQMITDTFGKMSAQGQVSLDQIWSISGAGVPALQILANGFGVTTDAMKDMVSSGAVPADKAMDLLTKGIMEGSDGAAGATRSYAGTMEGLRQTFSGAMGGMKASVARFGAAFLAPWMPVATKIFGQITGGLDGLAPKITAISEKMANGGGVQAFIDKMGNLPDTLAKVTAGVTGVYAVLVQGDFKGADSMFGQEEDSKLVDILFTIRESITGINTAMETGQPLMAAFANTDAEAGQGGGGLSGILSGITGGLAGISVGGVTVLSEGIRGLGEVFGFLADHSALVIPILGLIAASMLTAKAVETGYQAAMIAKIPVQIASTAATLAQNSMMAAHTAALNANTVALGGNLPVQQASTLSRMRAAVASGVSTAATWLGVTAINAWTFATSGNVMATMRSTAATVANTVASKIARGAALAWAGAQWLLNAAMSANPLALVVIAVVALVAAIVLAYKNSETFRNIVQKCWEGIKTAAGAVWNGFLLPIFNGFMAALKMVGDVAMWLWHTVMDPVFKAIGFIISLWWAAIQIYWELLKLAWQAIEVAAMWLWHNVIEPVFNGILAAVSVWWSGVQIFWDLLVAAWGVVETAAMWLWQNVFMPVFDGLLFAVNLWWTGVSVIFDTFMGVLGFVGDKVSWLWNTIFVPAFDGIKGAISTAWDFIRPVLDNIGKGIEAVGDIASLVGDSIRNAFDGVVSVVKAPIHAIGSLLASVPDSILGVDIPGAGTVKSWGRTLQNLRTGGVVDNGMAGRSADGRLWGPGNGTSDSILGVDKFGIPTALVSNREGIVTENAMDNGGAALVAALNSGWSPSSGELDKMFPGLPAFADGGVVIAKTLDMARGEHGKPYQYGGVGNPSWDCSGITSGVYASLLGKDIHTRWFTTEADFASLGFLPGFTEGDVNKGYNIGVHNGGGGMNSHMAGTLSGHKIESGGNGVQFDGNVGADSTQFEKQYHLDPGLFGGLAANAPKFNTLTGKYVSPAYSDTGTAGTSAASGGTSGTAKDSTRMKSFKELGSDMGGILAEGIGESLGLPDWLMDPQSFIESGDDGSSVRTSVTADASTAGNQAIVDNAPAVTGGDPNPAVPEEKNRVGMELYAYEIARAAKALGFNRDGATIGMGVPLVEVGDPMKMYANNKVPESLSFPHDAVGSDGSSVGIYQQSDNGAWGSVADRMDPYKSAEMFFNTLKDVSGWEGMDKGAAAQAVQRSAFPGKYADVMPRAEELLGGTSLFDTGGIWEPGTFGFNGLKEPELVLKKHQWGVIDRQTDAVNDLVAQGGRGRGGVDNRLAETVNIQGYTMDEVASEWRSAQWNRTAGYGTSRNR